MIAFAYTHTRAETHNNGALWMASGSSKPLSSFLWWERGLVMGLGKRAPEEGEGE